MPFRQLFVFLVACIAVLGAGLVVLSIGEDDEPEAAEATTTTGAETTTSTTTTVVPTTTSIPTDCHLDTGGDDEGPAAEDDVATTTTTTTTSPPDESEGGDGDDDPAPRFPTLSSRSSLGTVGLDEVTFGLTVRQAERATATEMAPCEPVSDCYRVTPVDAPEGISFVVQEGTIERVDIVGGPIETLSGIGVGSTLEDLDDAYGDKLEYEELDARTTEVVFVPVDENDAEFRVAFTTVDGVVESMRAGRLPLVLESPACG